MLLPQGAPIQANGTTKHLIAQVQILKAILTFLFFFFYITHSQFISKSYRFIL